MPTSAVCSNRARSSSDQIHKPARARRLGHNCIIGGSVTIASSAPGRKACSIDLETERTYAVGYAFGATLGKRRRRIGHYE